jgi:thiaminase
MADVKALVHAIRKELQPVSEQLLHHPYVQALEQGKIGRENLPIFAGEQYAIIASDLRSAAHLVNRFGTSTSRDFFLGILQGEKSAWDALLVFASALGLTETDLRAHEPLAGAHAYTCYMAWLALYASDAEIAAAYLINFPAWGQNCGRLSRILKEHFGLSEKEVAFFDLFASPPATFEANALSVIQQGLDCGTEPRLIQRAARLLQAYELMYWDTLCRKSKRPAWRFLEIRKDCDFFIAIELTMICTIFSKPFRSVPIKLLEKAGSFDFLQQARINKILWVCCRCFRIPWGKIIEHRLYGRWIQSAARRGASELFRRAGSAYI